jgi:hypothetical protein
MEVQKAFASMLQNRGLIYIPTKNIVEMVKEI